MGSEMCIRDSVYTLAVPAVNKRIKEEREGEGKKPVLDYLR